MAAPATRCADARRYHDQAAASSQLAEALATGRIPVGQRYAAAQRLLVQAQALVALTVDDRPRARTVRTH